MGKRNPRMPGRVPVAARCAALSLVFILLVGCAGANPQPSVPTQPPATATQAAVPTETPSPSSTPTQAPTATLPPTATSTSLPTETPVPALALSQDGFTAWCLPLNYDGAPPEGPDAPDYARKLNVTGSQLEVPIPATYCTLVFTFNQPMPDGTTVTLFDSSNPFLKIPLKPASGKPEVGWAVVNHSYVVNPPYWQVTYRVAVTGPDGKDLWQNPVLFAKPLPAECPFGGLPDPVTLWCTQTDPYEVEPVAHPTYPYNRSAWETAHPPEP